MEFYTSGLKALLLLRCLAQSEADEVLKEVHSVRQSRRCSHPGSPSTSSGLFLADLKEGRGEAGSELQGMPVLRADLSSPCHADDSHRIADPVCSVGR